MTVSHEMDEEELAYLEKAKEEDRVEEYIKGFEEFILKEMISLGVFAKRDTITLNVVISEEDSE
jgi:hypothetical protein